MHGWAVCCPFQLWGCFRKEIKKEKDQKRVWEDEDAGRLEHSMLKRSVEQDLETNSDLIVSGMSDMTLLVVVSLVTVR